MAFPTFKLGSNIRELDAQIRGRLIYRIILALEQKREGSFVFAGWIISYELDDENVCWVGMQEGFLWAGR